MSSADKEQEGDGGGREAERGPSECELRPFAHPVSDALLLAAVERAERHSAASRPGVPLGDVFAHMGFVYNGAATRQLRPRLDALIAGGALDQTRRRRTRLLVLTSAGRRRLTQAECKEGPVWLPESPQHRRWRHSRAAADARLAGYRDELRGLLDEAAALLDAGIRAQSDAWFCLAKRLPVAAVRVGAAIYCLVEWAEPDDSRADIDDYSNPRDGELSAQERARCRYLRIGRRYVIQREASELSPSRQASPR